VRGRTRFGRGQDRGSKRRTRAPGAMREASVAGAAVAGVGSVSVTCPSGCSLRRRVGLRANQTCVRSSTSVSRSLVMNRRAACRRPAGTSSEPNQVTPVDRTGSSRGRAFSPQRGGISSSGIAGEDPEWQCSLRQLPGRHPVLPPERPLERPAVEEPCRSRDVRPREAGVPRVGQHHLCRE
jgi:hypothetical protein